jgi:transposase
MKFLFQIPIHRQLECLNMNGYEAAAGTIIGGFKNLSVYLDALYKKLVEISVGESHWHADETSWFVFEDKPGKTNHRWWLWTFVSEKVTAFVLDPSRSSKVPEEYFDSNSEGIINVDRYAAYNILKDRMKKALCWYHLRRDFIKAMEASKSLQNWSEQWVKEINEVEMLNDNRIEFIGQEAKYEKAQEELDIKLAEILERCDKELKENTITKRQATILNSLKRNWDGYIVFAKNPNIPMHNNIAENALRSAALRRKNYYGSQSEWSGNLAAYCMSIFQTADKHKLNVFKYMEYYFDSCAQLGEVPKELDVFLPWNISEEVIEKYDMRRKGRGQKRN